MRTNTSRAQSLVFVLAFFFLAFAGCNKSWPFGQDEALKAENAALKAAAELQNLREADKAKISQLQGDTAILRQQVVLAGVLLDSEKAHKDELVAVYKDAALMAHLVTMKGLAIPGEVAGNSNPNRWLAPKWYPKAFVLSGEITQDSLKKEQ